MSDQPIRILVVDDSATTRRMLTQLVDAQPDMEVIDTAATGHEAVRRATEHQPDIILMDIHMPDMDGIQATWLLASKAPYGAVIMVTSEDRIDFLQRAMIAGAQGYILKPFGDGAQLLETIRHVHQRSAARRVQFGPGGGIGTSGPMRLKVGKRIAVFGAKGGVGRTSVAIGLAMSLRQQTQSSILLFDADFLFGDIGVRLDLPTERSILDLVPYMDALDSRLVDQVVGKHASGVHVLSRPPRPEQADVLNAEHVRAVLSAVAQSYDYIVLDTQLSYDDRMLAVLDLADVFVIVLVPSLGSLRNTRHFLEVARTLGYSQDRMCFVLNRANSLGGLTMKDVTSSLGVSQLLQIPSAGTRLTQAINEGKPYVLEQPRAPFSRALLEIADHVRRMATGAEVARS